MKISVIGCGYLGAVHAAGLASLGHDVVGVDPDRAKIETLTAGRAPFYEPGLGPLLASTQAEGRLRFSTDPAAVAGCQVHFVCVGTPQVVNGQAADLAYVHGAMDDLAPHLHAGDLVVGKSTVPVGTAEELAEDLQRRAPGVGLAWNPEFLREGHAVEDTLCPDRIVVGLAPGSLPHVALLREVYESALSRSTPWLQTDLATAQLVKVAANSFLATKISFINAMAELCEATGADVTELADALGHDKRIGRQFLDAGVGFGGGCLPKDIRAFTARAEELGLGGAVRFLSEVDQINLRRRDRAVDLARVACGGSFEGRRVAVLGAAFKPHSDDVRDSPALSVADQMRIEGAEVVVTDPQAIENARARFPDLKYTEDSEEAVNDAEVVLLLTEWPEYRALDPVTLGGLVRRREIVDGRNVLDGDRWRAAGWCYQALGRRVEARGMHRVGA